MRHIGSFANEAQARFFTDFLLSREIPSHLEPEADRTWSVWIRDEDQIVEAQSALTRFQANPIAPEFQKAPEAAAKARQQEAEDLAKYRRRIRSGRSLFVKFGNYGIGPLTFTLILVCVYVAIFSRLGRNDEWLRVWHISDPENPSGQFLSEFLHGQIWRLFTPIFIHYGPIHLIFNMLWFYQLGSMIEARQNSLFLLAFIAVSAAFSNLAQYYFVNPGFGGMSGVVYALAGYIWIRGKYDRASGLFLPAQSITILVVWLVICCTGAVGPVANAAHLAGLITGMLWGAAAAFLSSRKPE
ncbi:MAG TPA: rhomboid family intramembrane serine protease [Verrucomicrobiae bacterium]|jgi:GlpG protein|nr:rhomboid family intramembrane serine protease [Verrucomicrobiae bacterium]